MESSNISYLIGYRGEDGQFWCEGEYASEDKAYLAWTDATQGIGRFQPLELIQCFKSHTTLKTYFPKHMRNRVQSLDDLISECTLMEADSEATRTMEKAIDTIQRLREALNKIIETTGDVPYDPNIHIACKRIAREALE